MGLQNTKLTYGITTEVVVVGSNPEMADMTNPNGDLHGLAHYIVGETSTGRRIAHKENAITRNGQHEAGPTVERLEALVAHLNKNHPTLNIKYWTEIQPCYGSEAYQANGCEETNRLQEIQELVADGEMSEGEAFHLSLKTVAPL